MKVLSGFLAVLLSWVGLAFAHPGRLDSAGGHYVKERFVYEDPEIPPSEPGEYHFHKFIYPPEEFEEHMVGQNEHGQIILKTKKRDGTEVQGIMRFRRD